MKITKCKYCGAETTIKNKTAKNHFCNKICYDKFQNNKIDVICDYCSKIFSISHAKASNKIKFCSRKCSEKFRSKPNEIIKINNNISNIKIRTKKDGIFVYAIIDNKNIPLVSKYIWNYCGREGNKYVCSTGDDKISLHRLITNCPNGLVVDHINHNTLDNRKCNLRICSQLKNCQNRTIGKNNTTGYTGIGLTKNGKYIARICFNKKNINLGTFDNIEDAINVRNNAKYNLEKNLCNY